MIIAFTTAKRHQVLFRRSEDDKYSDQLFNVYLQMILCSNLTYVIFPKRPTSIVAHQKLGCAFHMLQ